MLLWSALRVGELLPVSRVKSIPFRTAFNLLCWEGAFAMAYETWTGPMYISGLGGELGVGVAWVAFLMTLPWVGQIGQLAGLFAFERISSVKRYTLWVAAMARALWILPLFCAGFWGWKTMQQGQPFPKNAWFAVLGLTACFSALFASSSAVAWNSWMRGLIPANFRGRFFGIRHTHLMGALILANLSASIWVGWKPQGFFVGYAVICSLALLAGALSSFLLAGVPDVRIRKHVKQSSPRPLIEIFIEPFRSAEFRKVVLFGAAFNGVIQFAGPYFPYYFTKELHISMSTVALWAVISNSGCLLTAGLWGRRMDRIGSPFSTLWLACHLVVLSPLPYVFRSADVIRWIAPFEYFINGISWAGFFLSMTALVFRTAPDGKNASYFSVYAAVVGLACAIGTLLGGRVAEWLTAYGGFRALWIVGSVLRLGVLWGLCPRR